MRKLFVMLLGAIVLLTAACNKQAAPLETQYKIVTQTVPAPCPEKAVGAKLLADRPKPLRLQERPADASVRSAKSQAQLGMYEAEGGWGDQVVAALERCQAQ